MNTKQSPCCDRCSSRAFTSEVYCNNTNCDCHAIQQQSPCTHTYAPGHCPHDGCQNYSHHSHPEDISSQELFNIAPRQGYTKEKEPVLGLRERFDEYIWPHSKGELRLYSVPKITDDYKCYAIENKTKEVMDFIALEKGRSYLEGYAEGYAAGRNVPLINEESGTRTSGV